MTSFAGLSVTRVINEIIGGCELPKAANNVSERKMKRVVLSRKNSLFVASALWLNMIERFFRGLTNQLRRGVFQDLEQLIIAIGKYIDSHNENPKPFIMTAKANDIWRRSRAPGLSSIH